MSEVLTALARTAKVNPYVFAASLQLLEKLSINDFPARIGLHPAFSGGHGRSQPASSDIRQMLLSGSLPCVGTLTIAESAQASIVLFALPRGARLFWHDHPRMHVGCKVLWGTLHQRSADWSTPDGLPPSNLHLDEMDTEESSSLVTNRINSTDSNVANTSTRVEDHNSYGSAHITKDCALTIDDGVQVIGEHNRGGVVHEFWASDNEPCVFCDVISPPYTEPLRPCTYFQPFM